MTRSILFALVSVACMTSLLAQSPGDAQSGLITVETREVAVDVLVSDRKGLSNDKLTAKDFSVWEDNKPQEINSVSRTPDDRSTASQRSFVLYFDFTAMGLADQAISKKSAADFIEAMTSPNRHMAVMRLNDSGPSLLQDFTTSGGMLKSAVMRADGPDRGVVTDDKSIRNLADSLTTVCASIAAAPGRKALLLFTLGYYEYRSVVAKVLQAPIAACNKANVAIFAFVKRPVQTPVEPVYVNGRPVPTTVVQAGTETSEIQRTNEQLSPGTALAVVGGPKPFGQILTDGTGGRLLTIDASLTKGLDDIAREQEQYYQVFYTPPPAQIGSCHTLRVETIPQGFITRARSEYCTGEPVELVADRISREGALPASAGNNARALDVAMQLPYFYTRENRAGIHLAAEVIPGPMSFSKDKGGLHGQIDIVGTVTDSDGAVAAHFADTKRVDLENQEQADTFSRTPYHYERQFTLASGTYTMRLDAGAGPNDVGRAEMPLIVEPWNGATLRVGSIAFSTDALPSPETIVPIPEGQAPLLAGGKQFVPTPANSLSRLGKLYFYTEVYDPSLGGPGPVSIVPTTLVMRFGVLDKISGAVMLDSGVHSISSYVRPGDPVVRVATRLPLDQLPAGAYSLEVTAGIPATQETTTRIVDFVLK